MQMRLLQQLRRYFQNDKKIKDTFFLVMAATCGHLLYAMEQPSQTEIKQFEYAVRTDGGWYVREALAQNPIFVHIPLPGHRGQLPLLVAAQYGAGKAVKLLLQHGADVNAQDPAGRRALDYASVHGESMVNWLLNAGADLPESYSEDSSWSVIALSFRDLVMEAVRVRTPERLQQLIEVNPKRMRLFLQSGHITPFIPGRDREGSNPLFAALQKGKVGHVELLVRHGALITDVIFVRGMMQPNRAYNAFHCARENSDKITILITCPHPLPEPDNTTGPLVKRLFALHCLLNRISHSIPRDIKNVLSRWLIVAEQPSAATLCYLLPSGFVGRSELFNKLVDWHIDEVSLALRGTNCSSTPQEAARQRHYSPEIIALLDSDSTVIKKKFGDEIRRGYEEILNASV